MVNRSPMPGQILSILLYSVCAVVIFPTSLIKAEDSLVLAAWAQTKDGELRFPLPEGYLASNDPASPGQQMSIRSILKSKASDSLIELASVDAFDGPEQVRRDLSIDLELIAQRCRQSIPYVRWQGMANGWQSAGAEINCTQLGRGRIVQMVVHAGNGRYYRLTSHVLPLDGLNRFAGQGIVAPGFVTVEFRSIPPFCLGAFAILMAVCASVRTSKGLRLFRLLPLSTLSEVGMLTILSLALGALAIYEQRWLRLGIFGVFTLAGGAIFSIFDAYIYQSTKGNDFLLRDSIINRGVTFLLGLCCVIVGALVVHWQITGVSMNRTPGLRTLAEMTGTSKAWRDDPLGAQLIGSGVAWFGVFLVALQLCKRNWRISPGLGKKHI